MPGGTTCHRVHSPTGFFRRFFSTGIPTSSYFPSASNRGWEARRPDLAGKFHQNGGWEARRLAGFFDWNTHFVVILAALNRGWEARRPDPAGKFTRMGAGRLGDLIQLV